jgi:hypothetical protein
MAEITDNAKLIHIDGGIIDSVEEESFARFREERQREVDHLSLELLSNTKHYKKYIAKNRPEEQLKQVNHMRQFMKHKSKVAALFIELLDEYEELGDTSTLVDSELQSLFKECVNKTIQHLEWSEYNRHSDNANEFDDEDVMFANTGFNHTGFNVRKKRHESEDDPYSFWGATIRKSGSNNI